MDIFVHSPQVFPDAVDTATFHPQRRSQVR